MSQTLVEVLEVKGHFRTAMKNVTNVTIVLSLEVRSCIRNDNEKVKRYVLKDLKRKGFIMAREVKEDCHCWSRKEEMLILIVALEKAREFLENSRNEKSKWVDANYVRRELSWVEES